MTPERAQPDWPPVVVASVFQTGLNLMRDLLARGLRVVGVDCDAGNEGFRSRYGKSYLCPNPDQHPEEWVQYMLDLARQLGGRPVIIPAADMFVSALGKHADRLKEAYIFSLASVAVQEALATKEKQYALAAANGFPIPRTVYVQSPQDLQNFIADARFPCLLKPRHHREWENLPVGNPMRGKKLMMTADAEEMERSYAAVADVTPSLMAQEVIVGGDDAKYCYLSAYGEGSRRLGHGVVKEYRAYPLMFGSASVVEPVHDEEIATLCDNFLRSVGYVGICEIEVKRDARDGRVLLVEANPRFSGTGDTAIYMGVEVGWLHYLDLIGQEVIPVTTSRFGFRHITLRRDLPALPKYVANGDLTWGQIIKSYQGPLEWFDFDWKDPGVSLRTFATAFKALAGGVLRNQGLRKPLPGERA